MASTTCADVHGARAPRKVFAPAGTFPFEGVMLIPYAASSAELRERRPALDAKTVVSRWDEDAVVIVEALRRKREQLVAATSQDPAAAAIVVALDEVVDEARDATVGTTGTAPPA